MEDLNAHLGRSDRFDRLSHHSGDGGFPLHPFLVLRGSMCSSYHNTIILPWIWPFGQPDLAGASAGPRGTWRRCS